MKELIELAYILRCDDEQVRLIAENENLSVDQRCEMIYQRYIMPKLYMLRDMMQPLPLFS